MRSDQRTLLTASMAYSTWKRCPSGENTVMALSYLDMIQRLCDACGSLVRWDAGKLQKRSRKSERSNPGYSYVTCEAPYPINFIHFRPMFCTTKDTK